VVSTQREGRQWVIPAEEYADEEEFREAVARELAGLENMGHRLGRGFIVTPLRRARELGGTRVYDTIGWAFQETFMPAVASAPALEPEAVTEELEPAVV
jgi:hypothetical protein